MCRALGKNTRSPTKLCNWIEAAVVPDISEVTVITLSLFMSTVVGVVGLGREDILTTNSPAVKLIPFICRPILLLMTSAVYVSSVAPCSTSIVNNKSLKLSN